MVSPYGNGGPAPGAVEHFTVDLLDFSGLAKLIEDSRPDVVYHLAALSSPEQSWKSRRQTYETNFLGTLNLIEAVLASAQRPRLMLIGSAAVYGAVPNPRQPITEAEPLAPRDPYGVSKAAQELLARQCCQAYGLDAVLLRPFNHTGPGQGPGFVCSDFARQIARIEARLDPPVLKAGNLQALRDFTDVRDIVEAYRLAALHGQSGEVYNIGSGRAFGIAEVLERLVGLSRVSISVQIDAERLRPLDVPLVVCDASKLRRITGWQPRRDLLAETLPDLLESWRERIQKEATRGV